MQFKSGQSSLEFLYTVSFVLLAFLLSSVIFLQSQSDVAALSSAAEAHRICQAVSAQISTIASSGNGTSSALRVSGLVSWKNYLVLVMPDNRSISVSYEGGGAACPLSTSNIKSGGAQRFELNGSTLIRNVDGGVVIG